MIGAFPWLIVIFLLAALAATGLVMRRRAHVVRQSEGQYRLLFEANPQPMWVFDYADWRFLAVNTAAIQSYGYSREEFLAMTIQEIRPLEDVPKLAADLYNSQEGLRSAGIWRHRKRDGCIILVEISSQPLVFKGKSACLVLAVDITERERVRQEIEWQRDRLQRQAELIDLSKDAIITTGADRVVSSWNAGAEKLYGWSKAEAVGRAVGDLLQAPPALAAEIENALQDKLHWEGELTQTAREGRAVTVDSRKVLRRDPAGVPAGLLEINRDVSDQRRLEEQLRQAQKLQSIGQLAGGVAHDFNNLMTIVSGYAGMALEELSDADPLRDPLVEISQAAARATGLTRQLLTFSCRGMRSAARIDLNDVVRDMERLLRRCISEDIALTMSLDSSRPVVFADRSQIEQVVLNLVLNARDAMPRGGKLIIEAARMFVDASFAQEHLSLRPGWYAQLSVTDTGEGMTPEVRRQCFEPFFTTKKAGQGSGLGLSTVYGIVKQSDGGIFVSSEPGRGCAFRIFLPAVDAPAEAVAAAPDVGSLSGNETILVVEDEEGLRKYVRETLERRGYKVVDTGSGREALQIARTASRPIDLLLTDMVMPEMNGAELTEAFSQARPHVPVLRMSGYSDRMWSQNPSSDFVQKPFTPSMLLKSIRTLLAKAGNN